MTELLVSGTTGDKNAAAIALGMIKNPRCTEELVEVLEDKVPRVRASAAWALGEIGAKKAVDSLVKLLILFHHLKYIVIAVSLDLTGDSCLPLVCS
ncbi:MAG: HEAT repeat domain-containing protein [Actinomycetota bacterium]|nr:HEAT repeat domain-containing protein [Actinomycetota bacterium]